MLQAACYCNPTSSHDTPTCTPAPAAHGTRSIANDLPQATHKLKLNLNFRFHYQVPRNLILILGNGIGKITVTSICMLGQITTSTCREHNVHSAHMHVNAFLHFSFKFCLCLGQGLVDCSMRYCAGLECVCGHLQSLASACFSAYLHNRTRSNGRQTQANTGSVQQSKAGLTFLRASNKCGQRNMMRSSSGRSCRMAASPPSFCMSARIWLLRAIVTASVTTSPT